MTHDQYGPYRGVGRDEEGAVEIDEDLRRYMLQVYNYMGCGLLGTALTAYLAAVSGLYLELYRSGFFWVVLFAPVILVFVLSFRLHKISVGAAQVMFWLYAGLIGLSLAGIFVIYMGLVGLIIASLVNLFFASTSVDFVISIAGVVLFTGLTAWDTQRIKEVYFMRPAGDDWRKIAIVGALTLYLDFLNLFLMFLRFFGRRRD